MKFLMKYTSIIVGLIISITVSFLLTYFYPKIILNNNALFEITNINFWIRFILIFTMVAFVYSHFIFNIDYLYKWLYKKRYFISLGIILFVVAFELNNSSIDLWNFLNTDFSQEKTDVILGKPRVIRTDEFSVYTPMLLSQNPDYKYFNDFLRGGNTDVFMVYGQPVKNIVSVFRPFLLGFLFFGSAKGLSLFWILRLIILFLISFEFLMLISNRNKIISLVGTLLITFAPAVQWWWTPSGIVEIIIYGEILILLLNNYINQGEFIKKSITVFLIMIFAGCYLFVLYPAWQIPMVYIFLIVGLWILMENYRNFIFYKKDVLPIIICSILFIVAIIYIYSKSKETISLIANTIYPGERFETGGDKYTEFNVGCNSFIHVFRYWGNMFLAIFDNKLKSNPCNLSTFFDFFPVGLIVSAIVLFKDKIKDKLLIMLLALYLFFTIWCVAGFPKFLAQITMMKTSPAYRTFIVLGFLNVLILVRSLSLVKYKMNKVYSFIISFVLSLLIVSSNIFIYKSYFDISKAIIVSILSFVVFYLILRNKIDRFFMLLIMSVMIVSGLFVNPVQKGIDIINDLPLSKVIRETDNNKKGLWIVEGFKFFVINFPIMQRAKTLNSINTYPNIDILNQLDKYKIYSTVYNRYANVLVNLVHENNRVNKFVLLSRETFQINMTTDDLLKLNIDYIVTSRNLNEFNNYKVKFEQIYYGRTKNFDVYVYKIKKL